MGRRVATGASIPAIGRTVSTVPPADDTRAQDSNTGRPVKGSAPVVVPGATRARASARAISARRSAATTSISVRFPITCDLSPLALGAPSTTPFAETRTA